MFEHLRWKFIERPLLPINNSYVDAFPFLILFFLLFLSGFAMKSEYRAKIRPFVQLAAFIFFIFVVHRCFCALRGWITALQEVGRNDLEVFNGLFVFVPLVAFTFLFGRIFCAWICPIGTIEELAYRSSFFKKFVTNFSGLIKKLKFMSLVILFFLCLFLLFKARPSTYFFTENIAAFWGIFTIILALIFLYNPVTVASLKKIRYLSLIVLVGIIMLGVFITDPWCAFFGNEIDYSSLLGAFAIVSAALFVSMAWCRFLCPVGAFLSLFAGVFRLSIKRKPRHRLSAQAVKEICYVEALGTDSLDLSTCLYCGRCVDCKVSTLEEK